MLLASLMLLAACEGPPEVVRVPGEVAGADDRRAPLFDFDWPPEQPLPDAFDLPSWVTMPRPDRIAIGWRTVEPSTATLVVERRDETPAIYRSAERAELHHVQIDGLEPATSYRYQIILDDSQATWTGVFVTPGRRHWRFVQMSEFHAPSDSGRVAALAPIIREFRPHLLVETGDMVDTGSDFSHFRDYLRTSAPWISNVITLPAHSNHANGFQGNEHLLSLFELPGNERWYRTPYSQVDFVTLDSTYNSGDNPDVDTQPAWIADCAARRCGAGGSFTVAAWHYPACSSSYASRSAGRDWTMDNLVSAFRESGGVDLVLVGHDKYYERSLIAGGIVHVQANAGRLAPSTEGDNHPDCTPVVTDTGVRSLPLYTVSDRAIEATVVDQASNQLDRFELTQ